MSVSKNAKTGKWEVRTYFKNIDGQLKQKTRRGFKLKSEALQWEQDFKNQRNFSLDLSINYISVIFFIVGMFFLRKYKSSPIYVMLGCGVAGAIIYNI